METKAAPRITRFSDYLTPPQVVFDLKSKDKVEAILIKRASISDERSR